LIRRRLLRFPRLFVALFEPDDSELGAQQRKVGVDHAHERGTHAADRLAEAGCVRVIAAAGRCTGIGPA